MLKIGTNNEPGILRRLSWADYVSLPCWSRCRAWSEFCSAWTIRRWRPQSRRTPRCCTRCTSWLPPCPRTPSACQARGADSWSSCTEIVKKVSTSRLHKLAPRPEEARMQDRQRQETAPMLLRVVLLKTRNLRGNISKPPSYQIQNKFRSWSHKHINRKS